MRSGPEKAQSIREGIVVATLSLLIVALAILIVLETS